MGELLRATQCDLSRQKAQQIIQSSRSFVEQDCEDHMDPMLRFSGLDRTAHNESPSAVRSTRLCPIHINIPRYPEFVFQALLPAGSFFSLQGLALRIGPQRYRGRCCGTAFERSLRRSGQGGGCHRPVRAVWGWFQICKRTVLVGRLPDLCERIEVRHRRQVRVTARGERCTCPRVKHGPALLCSAGEIAAPFNLGQ